MTAPAQLTLDLALGIEPSLENYVEGPNAEALAHLKALRSGYRGGRFVYIWGLPGSGKSHLGQALARGNEGVALNSRSTPERFQAARDAAMVTVDDVHLLDETRQGALFQLYNAARDTPRMALVVLGPSAPMGLHLREDLRTRLGWGLTYELRALDDAARLDALERHVRQRGATIAPDVLPWMLAHRARDMRSLLVLIDRVDRYAYDLKRPITLPLLREWLQQTDGSATPRP